MGVILPMITSISQYISLETALDMSGAVFGILWRAKFTKDQLVFSKETAQDIFVGMVVAGLWSMQFTLTTIGDTNIGWPPFTIPKDIELAKRFLIIAAFMYLFIEHIKKLALKIVPKFFERWTGISINGNGDDKKG